MAKLKLLWNIRFNPNINETFQYIIYFFFTYDTYYVQLVCLFIYLSVFVFVSFCFLSFVFYFVLQNLLSNNEARTYNRKHVLTNHRLHNWKKNVEITYYRNI